MVRQNILPNPSQKLFEAYMDFSGGLNSQVGNEMLKDNEFPTLDNVDLSSRGSAKRRTGRTLVASIPGTGQGLFYYKRGNQTSPDIVAAVSGKLYYVLNGSTTATEIDIIDPTNNYAVLTFQNTLAVSAVQYNDVLYVATGTKLCQFGYDTSPAWAQNKAYSVGDTVNVNNQIYKCTVAGTSANAGTGPSGTTYGQNITDNTVTWQYYRPIWYAQVVTPYTPTSEEAIYIGLNGLAADPNNYITDTQGPVLEVTGIQPQNQFAVVSQNMNMTCLIEKPSTVTSVKYQWSYRQTVQTGAQNSWTAGLTGVDSAGKTYTFNVQQAGQYDIQVVITDNTAGVQNPATYTYVFSGYQVYQTSSASPVNNLPVSGIQHCRNIIEHWDYIIMWGDDQNPWQMYISDLTNPAYFPMTNTIPFNIGKEEPITSVVDFRGNLIVQTTTSTQILTGKSPADYNREILNSSIGCIAERCAAVTGNTITFLSAEGVHWFKPNPYMVAVMDLNRVDFQIKNELVKDTNARAMVYDSQFWLNIPSKNYVYHFYYEQNGIWARDTSSKLHFVDMIHYGSTVHNLSTDGNIYVLDSTVYTDDGEAYTMKVESKYFDLGASFNWKKLKRIFFLARNFSQNSNIQVTVYADSAIVLNPIKGQAVIQTNPDGSTTAIWQTNDTPPSTPNPSSGWFQFLSGSTAGSWLLGYTPLGNVQISVLYTHIRGKARRARVVFSHADNTPCEVFGLGVEFKEKKPY